MYRYPAWKLGASFIVACYLASGPNVAKEEPANKPAPKNEELAEPSEAERKMQARPSLSEEDKRQIRELLAKLSSAFLKGKAGLVMELFPPSKKDDLPKNQIEIREALEREFETEAYKSFTFLEIKDEDRLGPNRFSVWVRIQYAYQSKKRGYRHENRQNATFLFVRNKHGRFALAGSSFFKTLGLRSSWYNSMGGKGGSWVIGDLLLAFTATLALMGFWVWMGFEAFRLRPRNHFWRIWVMLLPLLGALTYFLGVYLPRLRRSKATSSA